MATHSIIRPWVLLLGLVACENAVTPPTAAGSATSTPTVTVTPAPASGAPTESPAPVASPPESSAGGASPPASAGPSRGPCRSDGDCACGVSRKSGACAYGLASEIDATKQCPDFCSGIAGNLRTVCREGACAKVVVGR